jgi:hypothetical protein
MMVFHHSVFITIYSCELTMIKPSFCPSILYAVSDAKPGLTARTGRGRGVIPGIPAGIPGLNPGTGGGLGQTCGFNLYGK